MTAKTIAGLKTDMPIGVPAGISAADMHNLLDTVKSVSSGVSPQQYGAVGDGTADDTTAINAALATGLDVVLPTGTYRVTNKLTMTTARQRFVGAGGVIQIRGSTMATTNCLEVYGAGSTVEGIRFENPDLLFNRNTPFSNAGCIVIIASNCRVSGNTIVSWIDGIKVAAQGEFVGTVIIGNRLLEMLGAGYGNSPPDADTDHNTGEDRGDGIFSTGAGTVITGNFVELKAGQDGRIGIHNEGWMENRVTFPVYSEQAVVIGNNIVLGHYRRGIICEEVSEVSITGNFVAGVSWWGIGALRTNNVVISANSIIFDRAAGDTPGSTYAPDRSAITTWGVCDNITITGNNINLTGVGRGIGISGTDNSVNRATNISITSNSIKTNANALNAIITVNTDGVLISGNNVSGGGPGLVLVDCTNVVVTSNRITEVLNTGAILQVNAFSINVQTATINGNYLSGGNRGIFITDQSGVTVIGNCVQGTIWDVMDFFGCTNSVIANNICRNSVGTIINAGGTGNVITGNIVFTVP